MAKRNGRGKAWSQLSPSYRARITRQLGGPTADKRLAMTRWARGEDLRTVRGHPPTGQAARRRLTTAAPAAFYPSADAQLTNAQMAGLHQWRNTRAPSWLPNRQRMSDPVAAALSHLRNPSTWKKVTLTPAPAGEPWTMRVEYNRGYPQEILLPPDQYGEVLDLLTLVRATDGYVSDEGAWRRWVDAGRNYDVEGTP